MNTPLPVITILRDTFQFVRDKRVRLLWALTIPVAVMFVLEAIPFVFSGSPEAVLMVLELPFYIFFAITCHRLALMENNQVPAYGSFVWSQRETNFLMWTILICLALALVIFLSSIVFVSLGLTVVEGGDMADESTLWFFQSYLFMVLLCLPAFYLISRLSLLLPATAVDREVNSTWAWNLSHHNGWRLTLIVGALPLVFGVVQELLVREEATLVEELTVLLLSFVFLALEIVALSFSYKHLTEIQEAQVSDG